MILLDAPKGLGDALYLRAVVLHLLERGERVTVFTRWPEVFHDLDIGVRPLNEKVQDGVRHVAFSNRLSRDDVSAFAMRCRQAGIAEPVALRLDWKPTNTSFLNEIKNRAAGRKILVYQPTKTVKNEMMELMRPDRGAFARCVANKRDCFRIKLGHPPFAEDDPALECELDLFGKGFILKTFDVCTIADEFLAEPSFITVIAELLDRPVTCIMSRRAAQSSLWVKNITPRYVFEKLDLATIVYDDEI